MKRAIHVSIIILLLFAAAFQSCKNKVIKENTSGKDGWQQLFNGKDLTGWKHVGPGFMSVDSGLIQTHGGMGLLYWTGGKVGNCTIRVVFRMRDENDNSGIFIRIPIEPREEWMPVHYGYEVQIDNKPELSGEDEYHYSGTLYSLTKPLAKPCKAGPEWNTYEITLDGPRTIVYVNGVKVTDYTEGQAVPERKFDFEPVRGPRPDSGYFGIQNHSDNDVVFFKEIAIKPLKK
ncbi:MAG: 3-keto-disaccharide hydrolase [Bacteroidales bacterium]